MTIGYIDIPGTIDLLKTNTRRVNDEIRPEVLKNLFNVGPSLMFQIRFQH